MKKLYFSAWVGLVLMVMNVAIWQKQQILNNGETVLLKLAPVDPRSLMQGDYMLLRYEIEQQLLSYEIGRQSLGYEIEQQLPNIDELQHRKIHAAIIKANEQGIAEFVRLDDGSALASGEKRIKLHPANFFPRIKPAHFFFQEGQAKYYEKAEYGIFTFANDDPKSYLLSGLADKNLQKMTSPEPD